MLKGNIITLRPVHNSDLDQLYAFHLDLDNRGDFFPRGVMAQPLFHKRFQESGFWNKEEGMLVIVSAKDEIVGHIEFFKTVNYLDEYELSYQVYAAEQRGKGAAMAWMLRQTRGDQHRSIEEQIHSPSILRLCSSRSSWTKRSQSK